MKRMLVAATILAGIAGALLVKHKPPAVESLPQFNAPVAKEEATPDSKPFQFPGQTGKTRAATTASPREVQNAPSTNLIAGLIAGTTKTPRISHEQAESFASVNGRRATALLGAWQASGNDVYLKEAMENFPNDPRVAYMAWRKAGLKENPQEQVAAKQEWLEKFKQAAPESALPDYLFARGRLKSGDLNGALNDLATANQKPWRDYVLEGMQETEEAYLSAGFSESDAKAISAMGALLPPLSEFRDLGKQLNEIAVARRSAGDAASAEAALLWSVQMGERIGRENNRTLLQDLTSVAIQLDALKLLDPTAAIGDSPATAQQRVTALEQQKNSIREVARASGEIMPRLSADELTTYFDRLKLFGEAAAVEWAKGRMAKN